ncbi:hypothetical protein KKR89_16720 [Cellulomonas dongxiuzhuiae]|uniref:Uncharacterized protein n=2 Tax=Cellulomonas dongxiuzhuiae TaxID=2819979 RepID=A0ABX8GIZ3_9CELL|nr:hypothetical protein [Cellulomonas dongxiuzhuiae]QWC15875.1 hypothetical protein KKR89_16720 [Cellulomonas dongxiuzhuiae]
MQTASLELRGPGSAADSVAEAIAIVEQRIAAQPDPSKYEVIDLVA